MYVLGSLNALFSTISLSRGGGGGGLPYMTYTDTDTVFISFRFAAKAELHEWGQYYNI